MTDRKLGLALTLGIVLEAMEILRRLPSWLLVVAAMLVLTLAYLVYLHPWWTAAILVALFALRVARPRIGRSRL